MSDDAKPLSEGAAALKALVERPTKTEIAERIGVSKQALDQWIRGESRPVGLRRQIIEKLFGIPESAWLTDAERAELAAHGVDLEAPETEPESSPVAADQASGDAA